MATWATGSLIQGPLLPGSWVLSTGGNRCHGINGHQINDNGHNDEEVITGNIDPDSPSTTERKEEEVD